MRLIDADALIKEMDKIWFANRGNCLDVYANIDEAPTIEAEPVRHGWWEDGAFENSKRCSVCKNYASKVYCHSEPIFDYKRCPNCGAKMDLEENA